MPVNSTWLAYCPKDTECQAGERCKFTDVLLDSSNNPRYKDGEFVVGTSLGKSMARLGEPVVRGRVEGHLVTWHPECWLQAGIAVILSRPFNGRGPGRRPLDLSTSDKTKRKLILNRHAAYNQKINRVQARLVELSEDDLDCDLLMLEVQSHSRNQDKIWWEIQDYGKAPDTWRIPEGGENYIRAGLRKESE